MDGYPMDTCANIAVSSELMAILSVARDLEDPASAHRQHRAGL